MAEAIDAHPFLDEAGAPMLLQEAGSRRTAVAGLNTLDWRQALGGGALTIGFLVLALGWWGVSGTLNTADQLSYLLSGGLAGAALVATGLTLLVSHEHAADRAAIGRIEARLTQLEEGLAGEFDTVLDRLDVRDTAPARVRSGATVRP
jgi:hypothetical protein